ncbi:MAG: phage terminase large subunit family protein [bacterium]
MKLLNWAIKHISLKGERFPLDRHPYLYEIYNHNYKHEVYRKAAQVGISTYHIIKALWLADLKQVKVVYFFPTDNDVADFSQDRFQIIINESSYLSSKIAKVNKVHLKKIGKSTIYFRGLIGRARARSIDADYVILDELDACPLDKIEYAKDRILHSNVGWISELSTPFLPGIGIDLSFSRSDKRLYITKCEDCGWCEPVDETFPESIYYSNDSFYLCCPICKRPLDLSKGQWTKTASGSIAGYHISHLITGIRSISEIMKLYQNSRTDSEKTRFFNSILGLPYSGELRPLTRDDIENCISCNEMWSSGEGLYMGVDFGEVFHLAIGMMEEGIIKVVNLREVRRWEEIYDAMDRFGIVNCVIDALPYKYFAKKLCRAFLGRVRLSYFREGPLEKRYEGEVGGFVGTVKVDRTECLDELVWMIKDRKLSLPAKNREVEIVIRHLLNLTKERVLSSKGVERLIYRSGVENHFAMALNYLIIAIKTSPIISKPRMSVGIKRKFIR